MDGHAFVPPMPVPRERPPGAIELVRLLRRNLLDLFLERTYRSQVIPIPPCSWTHSSAARTAAPEQ